MNISGFSQVVMLVASLFSPAEPQDYDEVKYKLNFDEDTLQTAIVPTDTVAVAPKAKIAIAVMELDANGITPAEGKALSDRLRIELFNAGVFLVMERDKMNKILDEMQFQMSGCTSDECVVEVGRIVGVKKIIAGSVSKVGEIYSVSIRLIDVETSKIEATAIEDYEGSLGSILTLAIPSVARQISGLEKPKYTISGKKTAFKISTQPFGAAIYVDDLYHGNSPIEITVVPNITHKLTIISENYEKWEQYYDIKKDQLLEINVALSKKLEPVVIKPAEKPRRQYNKGFKIRYADLRIARKINQQVESINDALENGDLFRRSISGTASFDQIKQFSGIELYNLRQLGNWLGFDFGLGFYRSEFVKWINNMDGTYADPKLVFWAPTLTMNLRIAPIHFPLFYPYANFGIGYNLLILEAVVDNESLGGPVFHDWGLLYGIGIEIRPFKAVGLAVEWNHRVMNYELMDADNIATGRFKNEGLSEMDLTGNNIGLSLNLYY